MSAHALIKMRRLGGQGERVTEHRVSPQGGLRGLPLVWSPERRKRYTACAEGMKRG